MVPSLGLFIVAAFIPLRACVRVTKELFAEDFVQSLQNSQGDSKQNTATASSTCPDQCDSCGLVGGRCDPGGCAPGFGVTSAGQCDNCTDHCDLCNETGAGACDSGGCASGYGPTANGQCEPCTENCTACEGDLDKCDHGRCLYRYGPNQEGKCEPCPEDCFFCNDGAHKCDAGKCYYGTTQDEVTGLCIKPCAYQFGRNSTGDCVPCPENCFYCNERADKCDPGQCYHGSIQDEVTGLCKKNCEYKFGRNSSGDCVPCPENCFFCNDGADKCDEGKCYTGFEQHPTTGLCHASCAYKTGRNPDSFECEACPENCFYCNNGPSQCDKGQCYPGYAQHPVTGLCHASCDYKTGRNPDSFECEPCPENCFFCNNGPSQCDKGQCYNGYVQHPITGLCHENCDYLKGRNPESFECEPCPENCFYCNDGPNKCDMWQCFNGYQRNSSGLCEKL